jgi:small-conductance mechanosensitive channel
MDLSRWPAPARLMVNLVYLVGGYALGSAIALLVFTLVTAAHFRVRGETGASTLVLSVAVASTVVVLLTFALTTLVEEPATAVALAVIVLLSVALDVGWKRIRDSRVPA